MKQDDTIFTREIPQGALYHPVQKPAHYNLNPHGIEAIAAIEAAMSQEEFLGYLRGNVFKYSWRCRYKGHAIEDIEKAAWYLSKFKEKYIEYGKAQETQAEGNKAQKSCTATKQGSKCRCVSTEACNR